MVSISEGVLIENGEPYWTDIDLVTICVLCTALC